MVGHFPLEGDGCVPALFHYIWSKNSIKQSCPLVNVPDTVVYKYRQPAYWYFTSKDPSGGIKMKNKSNLGNVKVEESLCSKPAASNNEVVAYYISSEQTPLGMQTTIEHFNVDGLRDFLYNHEKENNGILQRFVDSKGYGNTLFRAIWSPNVFHVERRANRIDMADKKYSMHQRVVTFEGGEHFSDTLTVTDTLLGSQIQRICESIVDHCGYQLHLQGDASHISRMVLHFKMDDHSRIWFLWCSSIRTSSDEIPADTRLRDTTPVDIHTQLSVPDSIRRFLGPRSAGESGSRSQSASRRAEFVCGPCQLVHGDLCAKVVDASRKCEITYKMVIAYHEHHRADVAADPEAVPWAGGDGELQDDDDLDPPDDDLSPPPAGGRWGGAGGGAEIPLVLRTLHPNMSAASYRQLRRDPLFLYSRMAVCDLCFLIFTHHHAPRLPVVDKVPSALLMDLHRPPSTLHDRPRSLSPIPPGGRETVMSGKSTAMGTHSNMGPSPAPGDASSTAHRKKPPYNASPSPAFGGPGQGERAGSRTGKAKTHHVTPIANDPVSVGGYTYAGQSHMSKAPRRSTRVAENFVASVATSQFTSKVQNKQQPLQHLPAPQPLDFIAQNGVPAASHGAPQLGESVAGVPETTFTLSVLQGEEAFLRSLQRGGGEEDGEERRIAKVTRQPSCPLLPCHIARLTV